MTELIVALVVAAASGVAFLSYRHSDFAVFAGRGICALSVLAMVVMMSWDAGAMRAGGAAADATEDFKQSVAVRRAATEVEFGPRRVMGFPLIGIVFGLFIELMPKHDDTKSNAVKAKPDSND
jgi:hypothetical protein